MWDGNDAGSAPDLARNSREAAARESGPLMRTTPMPAVPKGVAMAAMVCIGLIAGS